VLDSRARERLTAGAVAVGVTLGATEVEAFARYLDLLQRWNRRINLTRIVSLPDVVDRHFIDSLAVAPRLDVGATLLDVGAGAGFPGAVVAITRPDVRVTLCESVGKKAAFLRALVLHLRLGCEVVDARSETLVRAGRRFAAVVSRAVLPLPAWPQHAAPLVAEGGLLLAMVAATPDVLPTVPGFAAPEVHAYALPDGSPRALLCWQRST
jgi:16S rRNA (guanine527-N7)-methyltransferase